jgi:transposase-like protein
VEQEAVIVAFRKHTLLPLDDCLYALQSTIPRLTRSSLHRCLERHGISRLPEVEGDKPRRKKFDSYPIGFFHIDLAEVRTAEGKLYLFVAIDRTSKFAVVELVEKADMQAAAAFLEALVGAVPYRIHTVLTDNGIKVTQRLMRHGQSKTTLGLYTRAATPSKRRAHQRVVDGLLSVANQNTTPNSIVLRAELANLG